MFSSNVRATGGYLLERGFDLLTARLRARAGERRGWLLLPYIGYGNEESLFLRGRVLRVDARVVTNDGSIWENILATYRRIASFEVPNARIRASCGTEAVEAVTDEEGFFDCELKRSAKDGCSHEVRFELITPRPEKPVEVTGRVITADGAAFGVISDIDDTVIVSHATNLVRLAKTVFLQNARQRLAFPGVAALYRAFCGPGESCRNPMFYVSSSPWNLYDLILDFLELNEIPVGPVFLQDYGFDRRKFLCASHSEHKLGGIGRIMNTYPRLPFVLLGDSGQEDPEIYRKVLEVAPGRVRAIYIRDVSQDKRDAQVRELGRTAAEHGVDMLLVRDSLEAATHAAGIGLIRPEDLDAIARECARTKEPSAGIDHAD